MLAGYALFARPVSSALAASVRAAAALAGVCVAVGGLLVVLDRLPVLPIAPIAAVPTSLGGAAVAVSLSDPAPSVEAAAGVAVACGVLGFALVAATAAGDRT
ncbi:MAG: hypothetical protein ABEJ88_04675 [Halobacterium sp.]